MHPPEDAARSGPEAQRGGRDGRGDLLEARADGLVGRGEEPDHVGVEDAGHGAGDDQPGASGHAGTLQCGVEGGEGQQDPDPDDGAGHRVPERGQLRREGDDAAPAHPDRVADAQGDGDARGGGDGRHQEAVGQVFGEARVGEEGRIGDDLPERPDQQLSHGDEEPGGQGRHADRRRGPGGCAPQPFRLEALPASALLVVARPAPQRPLGGQHGHGEQEDEDGELSGGVEVEGALPDEVDAHGDGLHIEVLHRGEIGERLHHHQGQPCGQGRPGERQHHASQGLPARGSQGAGGVVRPRGLLDQRGARHQVDVRVQGERHHEDRSGQRADLGYPHVRPEDGPQERLHGAGDVEHGEEDEPEDVGRHGQRQDEQPHQQVAQREPVGGHEPRQASAHQ